MEGLERLLLVSDDNEVSAPPMLNAVYGSLKKPTRMLINKLTEA